jgi:hypothetical protein
MEAMQAETPHIFNIRLDPSGRTPVVYQNRDNSVMAAQEPGSLDHRVGA